MRKACYTMSVVALILGTFFSFSSVVYAGGCLIQEGESFRCEDTTKDFCESLCEGNENKKQCVYSEEKNCSVIGETVDIDQLVPGALPQLNLLKATSTPQFAGNLISYFIGILGTIALVVMIYGGLMWMFAMGNSGREEKAKEIVFWGAMGVIVILSSYAVVNFVFEAAF